MAARKASPSMPDPPSYLLEGRYLAEATIARGEASDVFSGTDTWSGEQIAIRLLRAERPEREVSFRRTAERLFGTTSPRLIRAIHLGDNRDGRPFLVTELLVGRNAESLGKVRWEVACEITRQAAAALAELHVLDLHHGDLRTSKLFVAASSAGGSRIKLLDLGTGERGATAAKDVRGLAGILYRFLVGVLPVPQEASPMVRIDLPGMPPKVNELLGRWLSEESENLTVAEVATELKVLVDGSTELVGRTSAPDLGGPSIVPKTSMIILDDEDKPL
jgi:hypothetical protein